MRQEMMGFWDGSGINWIMRKQSAPCYRQITAPSLQAGYSSCRPINSKKGSLYSITERRVPELIPDLGSQPAGDVSHKPGGS